MKLLPISLRNSWVKCARLLVIETLTCYTLDNERFLVIWRCGNEYDPFSSAPFDIEY